MQLHDAVEVAEVYDGKTFIEAISKGWRLLAVTAVNEPHGGARIVNCYVMGKPKAAIVKSSVELNPKQKQALENARKALEDSN